MLPLAGLKVIDLSSVVFGPYCAQWFADLGADVVKLEAPDGDSTRQTGIARASYEVDAGFRERFLGDSPAHDGFFMAGRDDRFQFDLEGFVAMRLAAAGVRHVTALGIDTYPDATRWFSYRRTTHAGEPDYGRQISIIAL